MSSTRAYFDRFFDEKDLPYRQWEITDVHGSVHLIDSDHVIATLRALPEGTDEARKIRATLVRIDFANGDVGHYLGFLAHALVRQYTARSVSQS
jgi:hypothetical protein